MPSGSKNQPSGQTTTNVQPWAAQQPYLQGGFQKAADLYFNDNPQYYPGATIAPVPQTENDALNSIIWRGLNDPLSETAANQNQQVASGNYLWSNPANSVYGSLASTDSPEAQALSSYTSGARVGADNPYTTALTDSIFSRVVPQIQSQFIAGGGLSSPEAARATAAGATAALAPSLFQQQQTEEQNQMAAAGQLANQRLAAGGGLSTSFEGGMNDILRGLALSPATDQGRYMPYQQAVSGASTAQSLQQQAINDAVQRWNWEQQLPQQKLNQYLSQVGGTGYGSSTTTPFFTNPTASTLGAVGGGLSALGAIPSAISGISSLFGFLSDRRAKEAIHKVGKLDNGLPVYAYRYKGDPDDAIHIGLMADEVEHEHPEAVRELPAIFGSLAGLKTVDYARAVQ